MTATEKMMQARTSLVLDDPFFGALSLRLTLQPDPGCKTAWVNGSVLGYEPAFIDSLTHAEIVTLLAHEVMHCAAGHPWRRDGRDQKRWNHACDLAINGELIRAGYQLPECGAKPDAQQDGKSAEWIFARLPEPQPEPENTPETGKDKPEESAPDDSGAPGDDEGEPDGNSGDSDGNSDAESETSPDGQPGDGEGEGAGDPLGEVRDAPSSDTEETSEQEWREAVQQAAAQAKARGNLPGGLGRFAKQAVEPRVDWRATLRRFLQMACNSDYSWSRPNQRYAALGVYLPALRSEEMGPLAIAVDTSGSIDDQALAVAKAELLAVIGETNPLRVHVFYADARVARADTFERGEPVDFQPAGGGGTDFRPVFDAIAELDEPPVALVYITDLEGSFPPEETIPTLWVTANRRTAPFGETVRLQ